MYRYRWLDGVITFVVWLVVIGLIVGAFWLLFSIKWQGSNDVVSGIVYDTTNDGWLSGNTTFKVRASENMAVTEDTSPVYCLPPNSKYIELVNKAAEDKSVKVIVKSKRAFAIMLPWGCMDNVTVDEVKQ